MGRSVPGYVSFYVENIPVCVNTQELLDHSDISEYDIEKVLAENRLVGVQIDEDYEGKPMFIVGGTNVEQTMLIEVGYLFLEDEAGYYCYVPHFMEMRDSIRLVLGYY